MSNVIGMDGDEWAPSDVGLLYEVEPLYDGDMRIDALLDEIERVIYDVCGDRDVAVVSVLGVLDRVKWRLQQDMDD